MTWQVLVFVALMLNQLLSLLVFLVVYLSGPGWRETAIGRHLAYWVAAAAAVDAAWLLIALVRWPWLLYVLYGVMAVVGVLGWQRVVLVWRAQRRKE